MPMQGVGTCPRPSHRKVIPVAFVAYQTTSGAKDKPLNNYHFCRSHMASHYLAVL